MKGALAVLVVCAGLLPGGAATAGADHVWVREAVRTPVAPDAVAPGRRFVPDSVGVSTGDVEVGPGRAAALWLEPLAVVRVRRIGGAVPRYARVVGEAGARAVVDEASVPLDRGADALVQPPGGGGVWIVTADAPARIAIERPARRAGRLIWEVTQRQILTWIDRGGAMPALPGGGALAVQLAADAALGDALVASAPGLAAAVSSWRKARAVAALAAVRPLVPAQMSIRALDARRTGAGATRWTVTASGPGALRVDASPMSDATIAISAARRTLGATRGASLQVALFPGRHVYEIGVTGGPRDVRVRAATRRPRLVEALRGATDAGDLLDDAERALVGGTRGAALLTRAIAHERGPSGEPGEPAEPRGLPPLLALWWLAASGADPARAPALIEALPRDSAPAAVWSLIAEIARNAPAGSDAAVRAMIAAAPGAPPAPLVPALVAALPEATAIERLRSQRVAALDVAWRAAPLDPAIADGYRAAWRGSTWWSIPPVADAPGARWLCAGRGGADAPVSSSAVWRLPPGATTRVVAATAAEDPARAALLPVYVATPPDRPGPIVLSVDGRAFHTLGIAPIERLAVAVAPGAHDVRVDAPAGAEAWIGARPVAATGVAYVRRYWPTTSAGAAVRFALPGGDLPGPIQVRVRAAGASPRRIAATLRFDVGEGRRVALSTGGADPGCAPLDGGGAVSGELTLVVRPPAGAREVWFEGADLLAQVHVRQDATSAGERRGPAEPGAAPIEAIAALSHRIAHAPDDHLARLERAHRLLDVGMPDLTRRDLQELLERPSDISLGAIDELMTRTDDIADVSHAVVPAAAQGPVPIAPGLLGLGADRDALARAVPALAAWRRGGAAPVAAPAPGDDPVATYLAARARAQAGEPAAAGRALLGLYAATDAAAIGLEAARWLAEPSADRDAAPLAFAVASRVRAAIDHPALRRALAQAGARSRWARVDGVDASAGRERVIERGPAEPDTPWATVRQALLAAPWPASETQVVTARSRAVLQVQLDAATPIEAQVLCRALHTATVTPCAIALRVDHHALVRRDAPRDRVVAIDAGPIGPGRHVLEIALDEASADDVAAVRFVSARPVPPVGSPLEPCCDGRHAIAIERRGVAFAATPQQPVTVAVLGPGALRVEARAVDPAAGATVEVVATPGQGRPVAASAALPAMPDPELRGDGRRLTASPAADLVLLLPDGGPYRVTVRPSRGEALAQLALRVPRDGAIPRAPGPWWQSLRAARELVPAPAAASPLGAVDGATWSEPPPSRLSTLSAGLAAGIDRRLDEEDTAGGSAYAEATIALRGRLDRHGPWARIGAVARARPDRPAVAGVDLRLSRAPLPLGFSADAGIDAFTQADGASSVTARLGLTRRIGLLPRLALVPRVDLRETYLTLSPREAAGRSLDPDIYSDHRATHPRALTLRLTAAATPFQDLIATASVAATSNADLASLDRVGATLGLRTLVPVPRIGEVLLGVAYRPSYRFADDDRLASLLRHDATVDAAWTLWTGRSGRLVLAADAALTGDRGALGIALRYDLTRGRGLLDLSPDDSPFADLVEQRLWSPPELR